MTKLSIFNTRGSVSFTQTTSKQDAFITFTSPNDLSDVLFTKAPLTGVSINQRVDASILKALGKDFCISAFGDAPVSITLSGLSVYGTACGVDNSKSNIMDFYTRNKISTAINKRIQMGISTGRSSQAFTCAILSLDVSAKSTDAEAGVYSYNMSLVGVPL